jgi:hypothetical protein
VNPKPTYRLTIEALPRGDDPTGARRLKGLLKALLRCAGFRCIGIEETERTTPSTENEE